MAASGKALSFAGQQIYVGLDVHYKSWRVNIYSEKQFLKSFSQPPQAEALKVHLESNYPGATFNCVYEAGFSGFWIARKFKELGINCIVVHPADIPKTGKERTNKTDDVDSKSLALQLRSGTLNANWEPDEELESDRNLLRSRKRCNRDGARVKNRIHALLKINGVTLPDDIIAKHWSRKFVRWLETIEFRNGSTRRTLDHMLADLKHLRASEASMIKDLRARGRADRYRETIELLSTIPGISWLSAITLVFEIGDIKRFPRNEDLCSYVGLVPGEHSSGESVRKGSITPRRNTILRQLLVECSWTAASHDPELTRYHNTKCRRMKPSKAIISVAQRLLKRIRSVWLTRKPFVVKLNPSTLESNPT
jgi:transposase